MIDRTSPVYKDEIYRVKIGHAFLEKGYDIKGVMHVGANDGYEIKYYFNLGIEKCLAFEPLPLAANKLRHDYQIDLADGRLKFFELALGETDQMRDLKIAPGDGQGSSFYDPTDVYQKEHPEYDYKKFPPISVKQMRFDTFLKEHDDIFLVDYDCLTIDTQGTELEVLKGMGHLLQGFKYLNIELSEEPVYEGSVPAQEAIDYLKNFNFIQDSPTEVHNDVFFVRGDVKK